MRTFALALSLIVAGCGAMMGSPEITRTVGGRSRTGIFVSPYSYEHFIRGELAMMRGDLREAADEYEMARAGPEDDPLLIARLADVVDRLGREERALELLREGEALDDESESIWLTRGRIHERHERVSEARDAYARAASVAPESDEAPLALAALLRAHGEPAEADAVLERFLERAQGAAAVRARLALAIEQHRPDAAAEAVRALLEIAPTRADEVRAAARAALAGDRPELALELLRAVPETPADRELRWRAALAAGDRDLAESLLAGWMPEEPGELLDAARGYLAIGLPERAVELARVAIAREAGAPAQLVLGRALRAAGHFDQAASVLARIDPGSQAWPEGPIELARALDAAGRPALAAEVLARAQRRRASSEIAIELATMRLRAGDESGAIAALESDDIELVAARARVLDRVGRADDAAALYARLHSDDPDLALADRERARAEIAWREGRRDDALGALAAWIDRAPEDLFARARYAELLVSADRASEAREVAGETLALAIDPSLRRRLTAIAIARAPRASSPVP